MTALERDILTILQEFGFNSHGKHEGDYIFIDGDITIVVHRLKEYNYTVDIKSIGIRSTSINSEKHVLNFIKQAISNFYPERSQTQQHSHQQHQQQPQQQPQQESQQESQQEFPPPQFPPPDRSSELPPSHLHIPTGNKYPPVGSSDLNPPHPQFKPFLDPLTDFEQPDGMIVDKNHPLFQNAGRSTARYDPPYLNNEDDIGIGLPQGVNRQVQKPPPAPPGFEQGFQGGSQNPFGGFF